MYVCVSVCVCVCECVCVCLHVCAHACAVCADTYMHAILIKSSPIKYISMYVCLLHQRCKSRIYLLHTVCSVLQ